MSGTCGTVFIPRIKLNSGKDKFPFECHRRQFLVHLAYAMTLNKSQGQSVQHVGVDLCTPVFTHGQLYVALSRVTSQGGVKIILPTNEHISKNIVYTKALID